MFISKLSNLIESYDQYGSHRVNGLKATYLLSVLIAFNSFFSIPNPYFYYFYIPITALIAEVAGETIKEKYLQLFYCIISSVITVFLFNIFAPYWYFPIFAFFYSLFLYLAWINSKHHALVIAPVSLSLGAYSLLYTEINLSFYDILNNCLTIIIAMIVMFSGLVFFPLSYYYRLWLRSFVLLIDQMIEHLSLILENQKVEFDPVHGHTTHLVRYSNMLPRHLPIHTILKLNVLINDLHLMISVTEKNAIIRDKEEIKLLVDDLLIFKRAVEQERVCTLESTSFALLDKIISSWNHLCSNL